MKLQVAGSSEHFSLLSAQRLILLGEFTSGFSSLQHKGMEKHSRSPADAYREMQ